MLFRQLVIAIYLNLNDNFYNYKMRFYVHFATIQPRFNHLHDVIKSWINQTTKIEKIIITTSEADKRFDSLDVLNTYKMYPNLVIQSLKVDYGPNNKILGALKYYETIDGNKDDIYMIICDDDNRYYKDINKSYLESINNNKNYIYTQFHTPKFRLKNFNHLQGADTYMLTPDFFKVTTYDIYENYLKNVITECPEAFFQDDYVICYYIYIYCKLEIKTVMKIQGYTQATKICQLHLDPLVHEREKKTIEYFNKKLDSKQ